MGIFKSATAFIERNPFDLFRKAKKQQYVEDGKALVCPHCGCKEFQKSKSQLNTAGLTLMDMEFANPTVRAYRCTKCRFLMFFDTYEPGEEN